MTGVWSTKNHSTYVTFSFKKCAPKVTNLNDITKFCEMIELIFTHECYHNTYISTINDLYTYLHTHEDFATKDTLNRLFQTKEEIIEYSTFKI